MRDKVTNKLNIKISEEVIYGWGSDKIESKDDLIDYLLCLVCGMEGIGGVLEYLMENNIPLSESNHISQFIGGVVDYNPDNIAFIKRLLNYSEVVRYEECDNNHSCLYQFMEENQKELIEFAIDRLRNSKHKEYYMQRSGSKSFEEGLLDEILDDHECPTQGVDIVCDYLGPPERKWEVGK